MDTFVVTSGSTNNLGFPIGPTTKFNKMLFITPISGIGCDEVKDKNLRGGDIYQLSLHRKPQIPV